MQAAVVVPTNRPDRMAAWAAAWESNLKDRARVIAVVDGPDRLDLPAWIEQLTWVDADSLPCPWIIPRRTDCVRSLGFLHARSADVILTMDDDCLPVEGVNWLGEHMTRLANPARSPAWSASTGGRTRGLPYHTVEREQRVVLSHGLWTGVPDLDAVCQLAGRTVPVEGPGRLIPRGHFFPMCGMNLAFRRELLPAMYFGLQGPARPFDRFGDIWAGLFAKRICDHLNLGCWSGPPFVRHERASNVWANLRKEAPGLEINETLWRGLDDMVLTGKTVAANMRELVGALPNDGDYWLALRRAYATWIDLTEED